MDSAKAQVVMLASGSEVATLVEGAELLQREGIPVRVVSVPSEDCSATSPNRIRTACCRAMCRVTA